MFCRRNPCGYPERKLLIYGLGSEQQQQWRIDWKRGGPCRDTLWEFPTSKSWAFFSNLFTTFSLFLRIATIKMRLSRTLEGGENVAYSSHQQSARGCVASCHLAQANRLNGNEFSGLVEVLCQRNGIGTLTNAVLNI